MRTPRLEDPQAGRKTGFAAPKHCERVRIDRGAVDLAGGDEPDRLEVRAGLAERPEERRAADVADPDQEVEVTAPGTGVVEGPGAAAKILEPDRGAPMGNDDVRKVDRPTLGARIVEHWCGCKKPHGWRLEIGHPDVSRGAEKPDVGLARAERIDLPARRR